MGHNVMHSILFSSMIFFFKQKTAYEMRISDWSSDVCSSDLLVDEDDGRRGLGRFLEDVAQRFFALPVAGAHDLGSVSGEEAGVAFIGDSLRKPRLSGPRRAMEEHALGRGPAEASEKLGIPQRQVPPPEKRADEFGHATDAVAVYATAAGRRQ